MGIYISKMEMPSKKNGAVIILYPNGTAAFEDGKEYQVVEVKPHGRLIDADALRSLYDNNAYDTDSITNEEFDKMTVSVAVIRQNIDDMPTIIEANDSIKEVEWETHNDGIMYWWECSRCHHEAWYDKDYLPNYCPYCGAKMTIIEAEAKE